MKKILLIGGGGHCKSVIDVIESNTEFKISGIIDKNPISKHLLGYKIIGTDAQLEELIMENLHVLITIGQIKTPNIRKKLFEHSRDLGAILPVIISKSSYVSKYAKVGSGSAIMHGAIINACAIISSNCIINSKCLIEHDAIIGSHSHISTGAIINGNCSIGEGCFIGSRAIVINGVNIGANSIIGAGVIVHSDLPPNSFVR